MRTSVVCLFLMVCCALTYAQVPSHIAVDLAPATWSYTLFNDETVGSANYLSTFTLTFDAQVMVIGTPEGWNYTTDGANYVYWFNADPFLPYQHDVAPGESLGGFMIQDAMAESQNHYYTLTAWDHAVDGPGPSDSGIILSPSHFASNVPEPGYRQTALACLIWIGFIASRRAYRQKKTNP